MTTYLADSTAKRGKSEIVREFVLKSIETGMTPHDRLPAERELAETLSVSRLTVRRVLDKLEHEGIVYREQGSGTFVSEPKIDKTIALTSFSEDMHARGMQPGSKIPKIETRPAGAHIGAKLGMSPKEPVYAIERIRTADGKPICLEYAYLPLKLAEPLTVADLEGSLYEHLKTEKNISVQNAEQIIKASCADAYQAEMLNYPEFSPVFEVERVALDRKGRRIEYAISIYRGDRYSYQLFLHRHTPE